MITYQNGFQESMDYSRKCFVASRSVSAFLWLVLLGTILLMVFLPVDSWNGVWFCLIFGVAYPLIGLAQSALNYRRCPTGCDVSFQDGKLLFVERFDHDEKTFVGSRKIAVRLEKCRWRMGYMENLVSCHYHILPFSSFFPWRRVPVLEIVFQAKDLEDGNPTVTGCKIHDGKGNGVYVGTGLGTFTDCKIYGNANSGIRVCDSGNPTVTGCKIHNGNGAGVLIGHIGRGTFTDCEIYGNAKAGIMVELFGNPTVIGCKIHDCKGGVVIFEGKGTFNNNILKDNGTMGNNWVINSGIVKGSGNTPEIP